MNRTVLLLGCISLLALPQFTQAQDRRADVTPQTQSLKHGGKIESSYDGFNRETIMTLKKMKVTCDGFKDKFKDSCTSMTVELHCPGAQMSYVGYVVLKLVFQSEAWDTRHPLDQRDLSIVTDSGTLWFGRMRLSSEQIDTLVTETLETRLSYEAFRKIVRSESVAMQVGQGKFQLRDKNIAALRDLSSRIIPVTSSNK